MSIITLFARDRPVEPERLLASARARWSAILAARPDLAPAIDLQERLLGIVIRTTETLAAGRLPRLSLPAKYVAAKLERGVAALAGEPIPVPVAVLSPPLVDLCTALASGGAGDAAAHIAHEIETKRLDAGSLLAASLARDQIAIRTGAVHRGLAPDLVWLVAELAVSPFAFLLRGALFANPGRDERLQAALDGWSHGYCPACGSWPALAEVVSGHRILRCSFCAEAWELKTYACVYCRDESERFVTAAPDQERKDRRVEACTACGSYLKTVDVAELSPFPLLAIADLETMDLDMAAMERGYARPPLPERPKP